VPRDFGPRGYIYEEDKRAGASDLKIFSGPISVIIPYTFITSRRLSAYTCNNISTLARRARAPNIICIRYTTCTYVIQGVCRGPTRCEFRINQRFSTLAMKFGRFTPREIFECGTMLRRELEKRTFSASLSDTRDTHVLYSNI